MTSPKTYRKLQVTTLSPDFATATSLVEVPLLDPSPTQVRIKNIYAGVNATDVNVTAGRYQEDGKVPFDIGLEVLITLRMVYTNNKVYL